MPLVPRQKRTSAASGQTTACKAWRRTRSVSGCLRTPLRLLATAQNGVYILGFGSSLACPFPSKDVKPDQRRRTKLQNETDRQQQSNYGEHKDRKRRVRILIRCSSVNQCRQSRRTSRAKGSKSRRSCSQRAWQKGARILPAFSKIPYEKTC